MVTKYPELDGVILDRVRYERLHCRLLELSRRKFEEYLGKELDLFPDDIYRWKKDEQGNFYRTGTVLPAVDRMARLDPQLHGQGQGRIKRQIQRSRSALIRVRLASYFEVGVNFASKNYDPSADYDWASPTYKEQGYAELLELFTVGNYYTTITIDEYQEKNRR